MDRLL
jgi:hypothetical protein